MFGKKMYVMLAVFMVLGGGVLAWVFFYGDSPHKSPVRAKQVFNIGDIRQAKCMVFSRYNIHDSVQTTDEPISFIEEV